MRIRRSAGGSPPASHERHGGGGRRRLHAGRDRAGRGDEPQSRGGDDRGMPARAYEADGEGGQWRPLACLLRGVALLPERRARGSDRVSGGGNPAPGATHRPSPSLCRAQRATIAIELQRLGRRDRAHRPRVAGDRAPRARRQPVCALVFAAAAATPPAPDAPTRPSDEVRRGTDLLTELGDFVPWYGAEARILLAHASLGLADVLRARTLLAEASRFARRCQDAVIFRQWLDDSWEHIDTLAETSLSGPSRSPLPSCGSSASSPATGRSRRSRVQLGVSANTVKTQAHAVYRKLGAASRSEAVARASQAGLLGS